MLRQALRRFVAPAAASSSRLPKTARTTTTTTTTKTTQTTNNEQQQQQQLETTVFVSTFPPPPVFFVGVISQMFLSSQKVSVNDAAPRSPKASCRRAEGVGRGGNPSGEIKRRKFMALQLVVWIPGIPL